MSLSDVQSALLEALQGPLADYPTAYPNVSFDPPNDQTWAQVFFLPNTPSASTLGDAGEDLVDGIVQVDFSFLQGTGDGELRAVYEALRPFFTPGKRYSHNNQVVVIRGCGRSPGRVVTGWYRVSITIGWYSLIPR